MRPRTALLPLFLLLCSLPAHPTALTGDPAGPSKVTVVSSSNPAIAGAEITFTARIEALGPAAAMTPTGSVEFFDGSTSLGTASLSVVDGRAQASLSSSSLLEGPHPISARFSGDDNFTPAASEPLMQIVATQGQ